MKKPTIILSILSLQIEVKQLTAEEIYILINSVFNDYKEFKEYYFIDLKGDIKKGNKDDIKDKETFINSLEIYTMLCFHKVTELEREKIC